MADRCFIRLPGQTANGITGLHKTASKQNNMKITVKKTGFANLINPYIERLEKKPDSIMFKDFLVKWEQEHAGLDELVAEDHEGNPLPPGEYDVNVTWQFKNEVYPWMVAVGDLVNAHKTFDKFKAHCENLGWEVRIAFVLPEPKDTNVTQSTPNKIEVFGRDDKDPTSIQIGDIRITGYLRDGKTVLQLVALKGSDHLQVQPSSANAIFIMAGPDTMK
jgi:hypothetical protein